MAKNVFIESLKESLSLAWKNKSLFILLFILQIAFLIVFSFVNLAYQTKILEKAMAITDYMSQQKLDEATVASSMLQQKNILGDDPLSISRNFNEILKTFRLYLAYVFLLLIVFTAVSWVVTNSLINKNSFIGLTKNFFKIFVVVLFYLGLIFLFYFSLLNISLIGIAAQGPKLLANYAIFSIFSTILVYFMFVSLSLTHNTELKNIVQETLRIGIKKPHYIAAVYLICISLFALPLFLLFYFIEKNLFILLLSIILAVSSFVLGRIFMITLVKKLGH